MLAQAAQRSYGSSTSEGVQGQTEWNPGKPELVGGNLVHSRGLELGDFQGLYQPKLSYNSTIVYYDTNIN